MADLKRRLTRLEESAGELLPDQQSCPACRARELLAFSDEPENVSSRLPYDRPDGTCRVCRMPPPGTHVLQLPAPISEFFATLPWSDCPRQRFLEKLMLLKAIAKHDTQEVQRTVTMLHQRNANGLRHWRWPEMRIHDAETDPASPPA